jgi:Na+:H+ antiporter
LPLIEALLLLLVLSRTLGEISEHYGQPAMIGEVAAGVLLGPSILGAVHFTPEIKAVADLGVLLLVFLAGMEMKLDALWKSFSGRGAWVGAAGFALPMTLGIFVGWAFGLDSTRALFIGLCIAITALPVSVRILMGLGKLNTEVGQRIISASVLNNVVALLILGVILDLKGKTVTAGTTLVYIVLAVAKAIAFMMGFILTARLVKRYGPQRLLRSESRVDRVLARLKGKESVFALVLLFVIAFASFSEILGLHFVVGAFLGSMLMSHEILGKTNFEEVRKTASNITMGFLGPVFFAAVGLEFEARSLEDWKLVTAILVAAFAGKIFGGYLGGRLARLTPQDSWAVGFGLNGRGIMELVIANVALSNGFIGQSLFSVLVLMALVTTFATPLLLKRVYDRMPVTRQEDMGAAAERRRLDRPSEPTVVQP